MMSGSQAVSAMQFILQSEFIVENMALRNADGRRIYVKFRGFFYDY